MSTEVTVINERTKVSLYAVMALIPFLVAMLVWSVDVSRAASDAKEMSTENKVELKRFERYLREIDKRTIRIEEYLKRQGGR